MSLGDTPRTTTATALGGGLAVILAWILSLLGVDMPPEVAAAVAGVISTVLSLVVREKPQDA